MSGRLQNWESRLAAYLEERHAQPFAWGVNDCCLFACDGILTITGLDPAAAMFRGRYRGALDAVRLLKRQGGVEAIAEAVCAEQGWPEVPVALAQRGDVVMVRQPRHGPAMGLCGGALAFFAGTVGIVHGPTRECARAWAVAREIPTMAPLSAPADPGFVRSSRPIPRGETAAKELT